MKVALGEARLAALLPPNWQDPSVSVRPEDDVYIERPRDGSELTWQYRVRAARPFTEQEPSCMHVTRRNKTRAFDLDFHIV